MKLPIRRRKRASEAVELGRPSPGAAALQVLIYSNTGLSEQEFRVQTEKLRQVANYDGDTRSWYAWLDIDRLERAAEILMVPAMLQLLSFSKCGCGRNAGHGPRRKLRRATPTTHVVGYRLLSIPAVQRTGGG
jgi:hypothetical protein